MKAQTAETKELPKIKVQTFSEAAYEYLTVHEANKILASTLKQYKERLKLVSAVDINRSSAEQTSEPQSETDAPQKKLLGDCLLTEINRTMLQKVFNQLTNYSETTVKDCRFLTRAIFKIAVDDGILERNPINSVEIEYVDSTEKEIWTESEREIIMRFAKTDKVFGLAIFILNATGIRSNEMRALKPSDYIADRKAFHISRACKTDDTIDLPKNDTDRFVILLNDDEADFIAKQLQKLEPDKYILQNTKGEYLSERSFRKKYDKFFVRLNDSRKADDPIPD
ncbi:hypothetical protein FACS1894188_01710 [Clostridia bacterium]|nr:hypothetical protein FACS1894188_01710 [Clostridia bacterium]